MDDLLFVRLIFFWLKLHIGNAVLFVCNMRTKHAVVKAAAVLDEKRIGDFAGADDIVRIGTSVGIVNAKAVIAVSRAR